MKSKYMKTIFLVGGREIIISPQIYLHDILYTIDTQHIKCIATVHAQVRGLAPPLEI